MWARIRRRIITGTVLSLYGLGLMAYGVGLVVWSLAETLPPRSWPVVCGEVIGAHYVADIYKTKFSTGHAYVPVIRYRFAVDSRVFVSDRTWIGKPFAPRSLGEVEAFLTAYREGQPVPVRYDPSVPTRSTLFIAADYEPLVTAGAGLFLFLLSAFMRWLALKGRTEPGAG